VVVRKSHVGPRECGAVIFKHHEGRLSRTTDNSVVGWPTNHPRTAQVRSRSATIFAARAVPTASVHSWADHDQRQAMTNPRPDSGPIFPCDKVLAWG
jgi:hypothetical protein